MLAASYVFYWFAGAECLLFILYTTLVTYLTAVCMQKMSDREKAYLEVHRDDPKDARKAYKAAQKKRRFYVLTVGLLLGFGMLAVLKYTAFVLSGVNALGAQIDTEHDTVTVDPQGFMTAEKPVLPCRESGRGFFISVAIRTEARCPDRPQYRPRPSRGRTYRWWVDYRW